MELFYALEPMLLYDGRHDPVAPHDHITSLFTVGGHVICSYMQVERRLIFVYLIKTNLIFFLFRQQYVETVAAWLSFENPATMAGCDIDKLVARSLLECHCNEQ